MTKLKIVFSVLFFQFVTLFGGNAVAQVCPLGAKEDHLTIQRVMLNFGKFVGQADHVAVLGAMYPNEAVTDSQIADAIEKLSLAQACAEAVLAKPEGDLLPSKASFLEGAELSEYIEDFVYFMTEFRDELIVYRKMFVEIGAIKASDRAWDDLYAESEKINSLIDHSHRKTSQAQVPRAISMRSSRIFMVAGSLKSNMKKIEKNLKAIAASVNDASKNQENADLALECVELLKLTLNQTPEVVEDLPKNEQPEAMKRYQQEIQKGIDLCFQLQSALLASDITTATQTLKDLDVLKDDGHGEYNP